MTAAATPSPVDTGCRMVTAEEVEHYREFGWVMLRKFLDPGGISRVLANAKGLMGEDGDSNEPDGVERIYFNAKEARGFADPEVRPSFFGFGRAAKALMDRQADTGVRLMRDSYVPKLPAGQVTRNKGNGPTSFHQDFINFAVDRSGGLVFWVPLEAYGPEAGTMSFLKGSHQIGVLGSYTAYDGRDIRDVWPELRAHDESEQMTYEVGDVTVHNHLTVHGAGSNHLNRPRWAWIILTHPADACWNGAPPQAFDPVAYNMTPYSKFPDEHFPIIG